MAHMHSCAGWVPCACANVGVPVDEKPPDGRQERPRGFLVSDMHCLVLPPAATHHAGGGVWRHARLGDEPGRGAGQEPRGGGGGLGRVCVGAPRGQGQGSGLLGRGVESGPAPLARALRHAGACRFGAVAVAGQPDCLEVWSLGLQVGDQGACWR